MGKKLKKPARGVTGRSDELARLRKENAELKSEKAALERSSRRLTRVITRMTHDQRDAIQQERLHALGQMASGIVHDFNNALTPILGASDFLISNPDILQSKDDTLGLLDSMRTAARDARNMVRRLRGFYKPDDSVDPQVLDVNAIIEQAVVLTQPSWANQAATRGARITVVKSLGAVPPVKAQDTQLREMLINVILNAVDAMPNGGTITIKTRAEKGWVVIEVSDTGMGMSDEVRLRCFEPFFSTKGRSGTGMGLAIVYGIMKHCGGKVAVESKVGKGTTLKFSLPAFGDEPTASAPMVQGEHKIRILRALVIDDDAPSRDIVTKILEADGHSVSPVASGEEAIELCRSQGFDVMFVDFVMPGICGKALADKLREIRPSAHIVMMTGSFDVKPDGGCPDGYDMLLDKPLTQNDIREAISQVVSRGSFA